MLTLKENAGIPRTVLLMMAVVAGFTVANLYYNQPLLELMHRDLHATSAEANLITVITQLGYASGLFFVVPMGDLYSRRLIIGVSMLIGGAMSLLIALSTHIYIVWGASYVLGICSVVPQLFVPMAGQFSRPEDKSKNIGIVLSGLLTGILSARVLSGFVGDHLGWRAMYYVAALLMMINLLVSMPLLPDMPANYRGSYPQLLRSVVRIFADYPLIRLYAIRAAFGFGSMLCIWACLAFHIAGAPFYASSDKVGVLGFCGVVGALAAGGLGRFVPRFGIFRFSAIGAVLQLAAWFAAWYWGNTYAGLVLTIILIDIGMQCQQLSNQSGCLHQLPGASNRVNTIFMTLFFIGGSAGTFLAGLGWTQFGWQGVCMVGMLFAMMGLGITLVSKR